MPLKTGQHLSGKVGLVDLPTPVPTSVPTSVIDQQEMDQSRHVRTVTPPPAWIDDVSSRSWLVREAALLLFCEPVPLQCLRLQNLATREWRSLLRWMDINGLALYFFDRLVGLDLTDWLPPGTLARFKKNLADNVERTRGMIAESIAIQHKIPGSPSPLCQPEGVVILAEFRT